MFPTFISILDIQSWWEVPSIAHFCSLFRTAFNLLDFDIEDLEEALLTDGTEEPSWLQDLIVRLLRGCLPNNEISTFNYQMFLRRLFRVKCKEHDRYNPFNTDVDFQLLPLRTKVDILHALCDFRLDSDDVLEQLKNLEADSLRVEPLGFDDNNSAYWYFYGSRLYREDFNPSPKTNGKKTKPVWQVVCFAQDDWLQLTKKLKKSGSKVERQLYKTLTQNFLPELPRLFHEKERLARKRLLEFCPRRTSTRLTTKKKQEEEDESEVKSSSPANEDNRLLEKRRRQASERRARLKDRCLSVADPDDEMGRRRKRRCSSDGTKKKKRVEKKQQATTIATAGRQTNNSLSSAIGQIVIKPPTANNAQTKTLFKTSQVFGETEEDLQTGMHKVLDYVKNHEDAWPFVEPVEEEHAPNYYTVIRKPMDLQRMEERLESGYYKTYARFRADFQLIVDNCRLYNGVDNEYTGMVFNLLSVFDKATERYVDVTSTDDEIMVEFTPSRRVGGKKPSPVREDRCDSSSPPPPSWPPSSPEGFVEEPPVVIRTSSSPKLASDSDDKWLDFIREDKKEVAAAAAPPPPPKDKHNKLRETIEKLRAKSEVAGRYANLDDDFRPVKKSSQTDMDALTIATEQTLKDINKWLDDTPRLAGEFSVRNSPDEKQTPPPPPVKKEAAKRRTHRDPKTFLKKRAVESPRTMIDRLQPGKSKGNLITGPEVVGKVIGGPVVVDDATPQLSLGKVLDSFGEHKFADDSSKRAEETDVPEPGKPTPNLSAWFKAFGAPKPQPAVKKTPEVVKESEVKPAEPVSPVRVRRMSTGSTVSEQSSSFGQDSPQVDERLYPAPYPSPLHRTTTSPPVSAASPRPERDGSPKPTFPTTTVNGQIRVGFYQDTDVPPQYEFPAADVPPYNYYYETEANKTCQPTQSLPPDTHQQFPQDYQVAAAGPPPGYNFPADRPAYVQQNIPNPRALLNNQFYEAYHGKFCGETALDASKYTNMGYTGPPDLANFGRAFEPYPAKEVPQPAADLTHLTKMTVDAPQSSAQIAANMIPQMDDALIHHHHHRFDPVFYKPPPYVQPYETPPPPQQHPPPEKKKRRKKTDNQPPSQGFQTYTKDVGVSLKTPVVPPFNFAGLYGDGGNYLDDYHHRGGGGGGVSTSGNFYANKPMFVDPTHHQPVQTTGGGFMSGPPPAAAHQVGLDPASPLYQQYLQAGMLHHLGGYPHGYHPHHHMRQFDPRPPWL